MCRMHSIADESASKITGGKNGKFTGFDHAGPGVAGRDGIWHSDRLCDSARGFCNDATAASTGPDKGTDPGRANLLNAAISFKASAFRRSLSVSVSTTSRHAMSCSGSRMSTRRRFVFIRLLSLDVASAQVVSGCRFARSATFRHCTTPR